MSIVRNQNADYQNCIKMENHIADVKLLLKSTDWELSNGTFTPCIRLLVGKIADFTREYGPRTHIIGCTVFMGSIRPSQPYIAQPY
jgi:hypothetical protein